MVRGGCGGLLELGAGLLLLFCLSLAEARASRTPCDNGKINLQMDLPPAEEFVCPGPTWPLPEVVIPSVAKVYPEQESARVCMGERIEYDKQIPNSGMYRPIWATYGEYLYVPPQRWVHNLQRGGIAFLYDPCVHPKLKEELSLLARACMYKHIITPHLNLSQQWPLALVAWGTSLEMSRINLAEAVTWLRESVNLGRNSEVKDDGAYNYLLVCKAKPASDNSDRVVCPDNQVKELQRHFKKSKLQSAIREWNKVGVNVLSKGLQWILRRKRSPETRGAPQTSKQVEGASPFTRISAQKQDKDSAKNASFDKPSANVMSLAVVRRQPTVPAVISGDSEEAVESRTSENQGTKEGNSAIGGEQNRRSNELESTTPTLKEPPVNEAHQQTFLDSNGAKQLKPGDLTVKQPNSPQQHQTHDTSDSSSHSQVKAQQTNSEAHSSQEQIKSGGSIIGKANSQMVKNSAIKEQQIAKIIANINHVPDSPAVNGDTGQILQNGSKVRGKNVIPLHTSEISSKNDVGTKGNEDSDKSYPGEMGSDGTVQKVTVEETDTSKTNETVILNSQDGRNETAAVGSENVKCKCEDGASQNVQTAPDVAGSNNLKALKKTQHYVEDRTSYIPTPRTEEATWAAAALAFILVFLTLAVLYTRLYRKFMKSDSLYWAPVPGIDGQESVADIVKRRLTRSGKRRKKRLPYKKKSISPYDVLPSDNSD
ncbi:tumor protein p53-inducible protein 13 isoform X2 [Carcharodon carcharias]|uniref:tumor protein p53-inducible protein 13 isoform X2 n=1 Tax=Carcharodon carcharias TaxID=13397 RepID=UPI001B7F50FA|nr:tumor protein p53-inducible protein 13 isoform X2 [Carcharodon carcharias]